MNHIGKLQREYLCRAVHSFPTVERAHPHLFTRYLVRTHCGRTSCGCAVALNSPVAGVAGISFTHNTFNESTANDIVRYTNQYYNRGERYKLPRRRTQQPSKT